MEIAEVDQWLTSWPTVHAQYRAVITNLQRRKIMGAIPCAKTTIAILMTIMGTVRWTTAAQLLAMVKKVGKALIAAQPLELVIGNIVRRICFIVRDEHRTKLKERREGSGKPRDALAQPVGDGEDDDELDVEVAGLMSSVMDSVSWLRSELENVYGEICELALEHIHANEVILTFGRSRTIEHFLKEAAERKRNFEVIVAESAPSLSGQEMARRLAEAGIETTVISDSAVYAIMARVNQVLLPCRAMIANGGLIAPSGGHMIALAAKELSVPVVCVTGLFKLSPVYRHDQDSFNDLKSPSPLMSYDEASSLSPHLDLVNPAYDYVPPELVDLYITNAGGHQTSYVYRLLDECYDQRDYVL